MEKFKLHLEQLQRDARFQAGLSAEHAISLVQQVEPIGKTLENLRSKVKAIRSDSRLSDNGKSADVAASKAEAATRINDLAQQIGRHAVIVDLNQRISTKVTGTRERAQKAMGADAALLAQELRLHVIPKALANAERLQIPGHQALAKMVLRAAENYATDPTKAEIILAACTTGWPWVQADVDEGTLAQVNTLIARQVAQAEQQDLQVAQQVQGLLDRVVNAAEQEIREQR